MLSSYQFHEVNAFTRKGQSVSGNPAAICLVKKFPDEKTMGLAAKALGRPMTSFVCYTDDPNVFDIRHFSPDGLENHVCGHATMAAAELLAITHPALRQGQEIIFRLNPQYGITADNSFKAYIKGDDISLTMPAITSLQKVRDSKFYSLLAEALCVSEQDIVKPAFYAPRILNYVVELKSQDKLISMQPDFEKLKALAKSDEFPHEGIMATAKSKTNDCDIVTRVFLPVIGVDEDVACGSASCSVVPYWAIFNKHAFPADKHSFKNIFPYPPGRDGNMVGGIQDLDIDLQEEDIILKGQATYQKPIKLKPDPGSEPTFTP